MGIRFVMEKMVNIRGKVVHIVRNTIALHRYFSQPNKPVEIIPLILITRSDALWVRALNHESFCILIRVMYFQVFRIGAHYAARI